MKTKLSFEFEHPTMGAALTAAAHLLHRDNDVSYLPDVVCHIVGTILDSIRVEAGLPNYAIRQIADECQRFVDHVGKDQTQS